MTNTHTLLRERRRLRLALLLMAAWTYPVGVIVAPVRLPLLFRHYAMGMRREDGSRESFNYLWGVTWVTYRCWYFGASMDYDWRRWRIEEINEELEEMKR